MPVSHLRPEDKSKPTTSNCRKGRHAYGESQDIGAGIERRVCETCGEVTIDLTGAEPLQAPASRVNRSLKSRKRSS